MTTAVSKLASFVTEKYFHGVMVGFGIMTAHGIWDCGKAVKIALAQADWKKIQQQVDAEQIWFWRKR